MSYELDMSQYLGLFLEEAREQLDILEQETLKLEKEPSLDRLQVIFRAAHTLKGSARAMGFQHMAELTHEMENVLDNLRNGVIQLSTPITDALLACQDSLAQMVAGIEAGEGDKSDCGLLVRQLQSFVGQETEAPPAVETSDSSPAASAFVSKLTDDHRALLEQAGGEKPLYHAKFRLSQDCAMKYVRAFMALSALQEVGELLISVPDAEGLEEEQFEQEFEFIVQTDQPVESVRQKVSGISEMEWHAVELYTPSDAPTQANAPSQPQAATPTLELVGGGAEAPSEPSSSAPVTPAVGASPGAGGPKKGESGQTVRVDVTRLDTLMNLVGELVIDRTRIAQIGEDLNQKYDDPNLEALSETVGHIHRITSDLQDQIMKARMMPIETVFNRYPRVVRDLAQKLGKEVQLELVGGETELDRSVIEVIGDPLLHILRNSIDHGLETPDERIAAGKPAKGKVCLSARHQENHIVIEIVDDGKGIDAERVKAKAVEKGHLTKDQADRMTEKEALQLIFASGLSTAKEISEVSGRGVGMDIVRSNLQKLGGIIDLETTLGEGTKFSLRLPLTLAIIRGLLVSISGTVYVIPLGSVVETLMVQPEEIETVHGREVIVIRGLTTPLIRMKNVFMGGSSPESCGDGNQYYAVIVGLAEQRIGLIVDKLIGEREVVIKSLSRFCGDVPGISGATILGDGNVALIMDVNSIVSSQGS